MIYAVLIPVIFAAMLVFTPAREAFLDLTHAHPYIMGFIKFGLLATAGELIALRISEGRWGFPEGVLLKALVWGLIGFMMALLIPVYSNGVAAAQAVGLLPFKGNTIVAAIATSVVMNLTFGIAMMAFHRVTDVMIDGRSAGKKLKAAEAAGMVNWSSFVGFVIFKTVPFFWIPAHSITFALPSGYRVYVSAFLSIVLGAIMAFSKKKKV